LKRFLDFFPEEHLLVVSAEELFRKPNKLLADIFRFVGVDEKFKIVDLRPRNVGGRNVVEQEVYDYLNKYFYEYNSELYELVGENFGW